MEKGKIERFEDLIAWQKARLLTRAVYQVTRRGDSTAKSSCAEVRSQLYVALDVGYLSRIEFEELFVQAEEVGKIIGGLRASIEKQRKSQA